MGGDGEGDSALSVSSRLLCFSCIIVFLISHNGGEETEQAQRGVGVSDRTPAVRCGGWSAEESGWERAAFRGALQQTSSGKKPIQEVEWTR